MILFGVLGQVAGIGIVIASQPDIGMQIMDEAGWFWGTIAGALIAIGGVVLMAVGVIAMGVLLALRADPTNKV